MASRDLGDLGGVTDLLGGVADIDRLTDGLLGGVGDLGGVTDLLDGVTGGLTGGLLDGLLEPVIGEDGVVDTVLDTVGGLLDEADRRSAA